MLGPTGVGGNIRQVDFSLLRGRQFDLGLLSGFFQSLQCQRIIVQVHAGFFLEFIGQVIDQAQVEIFATEEGITVGREYFEGMFAIGFGNLNNGDIEGTTTEVVDCNRGITGLPVHTIGKGCSGRFIDDALDFEPRNLARIFGSLALGIVKISRHRHHRFRDCLAEVVFRGLLHLH